MARSVVTEDRAKKEASYIMLHVGLDLSRKRVDVCLISDQGELVDELAAPFDEDGLCRLAERVAAKHAGGVRAVVESMNGARFVHDTLEAQGWDVLVADAQRVKGLAPLACKTDKIDARVLAELSFRDLVPAIWLPDPVGCLYSIGDAGGECPGHEKPLETDAGVQSTGPQQSRQRSTAGERKTAAFQSPIEFWHPTGRARSQAAPLSV